MRSFTVYPTTAIQATSNKQASLKRAAREAQQTLGDTSYLVAKPNNKHNCVEIFDTRTGRRVTEIRLKTEPAIRSGYKYRLATDEELADTAVKKYVREKYTYTTDKQISDVEDIASLV